MSRGRWQLGVWAVTLAVLVTGVAVTAVVALGLEERSVSEAERAFQARAELVREAVEKEARRYESALELAAGALAAGGPVSAERFEAATEPMLRMRLAGATSVAFISPYLDDAELARAQRLWRQRGSDDLVLAANPEVSRHVFSLFSRPLDGNTEARTGIDVTAAADAYSALQRAAMAHTTQISAPYELLIDQDLPAAERQASFSLVSPVFAEARGDLELRGWVLMGIRGRDLMGGLLEGAGQGSVAAELLAESDDGTITVAETGMETEPTGEVLTGTQRVQVAQSTWTVQVTSTTDALIGGGADLDVVAATTGSALSIALAGLVYVLAAGRSAAEARVREATAGLTAAEASARRQAGLLTAVVDSISDGVGVVDADGAFLVHNPAAQRMLGVVADGTQPAEPEHPEPAAPIGDSDDPHQWTDHYGLFNLDGTPFPTDELPLVRALRGEAVDSVEMLVRNRVRPEGLTISVSARPLDPAGGQEGAVAVFRDVSAENQRRTELAAFAGIVAHDLKTPLAVVKGYLDLLHGLVLPGVTATQTAISEDHRRDIAGYFSRAIAAAQRMDALIQGLLDYTTARDATLRTTAVDLPALVRDVVLHHLDGQQLASAAVDVDIEPHLLVAGDWDRLRQVVENLVSNAVKYTRPAALPDITIRGRRATEQHVLLTIADRGIGIPPDQLPHIFEPFHRAHTDGYEGNGLGLAICHNIIARHNGTLSAAARLGGGTTFAISLPAHTADSDINEAATRPVTRST